MASIFPKWVHFRARVPRTQIPTVRRWFARSKQAGRDTTNVSISSFPFLLNVLPGRLLCIHRLLTHLAHLYSSEKAARMHIGGGRNGKVYNNCDQDHAVVLSVSFHLKPVFNLSWFKVWMHPVSLTSWSACDHTWTQITGQELCWGKVSSHHQQYENSFSNCNGKVCCFFPCNCTLTSKRCVGPAISFGDKWS